MERAQLLHPTRKNCKPDLRKRCRPILLALLLSQLPACVYLHGNFRTVEPGRVYRSGQLSPGGLERRLEEHNIRTVVSLRGPDPDEAWYSAEKAICSDADVAHLDLPWTEGALPTPESLAQLIAIYDQADGPILVHCQGGTHRAAVAAAVFRLLHGAEVPEAREEFGAFFNDAPIGRLLDLYEGSSLPFRDWVTEEYPALYARTRDARTQSGH